MESTSWDIVLGSKNKQQQQQQHQFSETKKPQDWKCSACNYVNSFSSGRGNCFMCDTTSSSSSAGESTNSGVGTIFVGGIYTGLFDSHVAQRVDEWTSNKSAVSAVITNIFKSFGEVTSFTLVPPKNGKSHSVAFLQFASWESCYPAIAKYNKFFLKKRGAISQDSFLVVSHTENARNMKSIKHVKTIYVSPSSSSTTTASVAAMSSLSSFSPPLSPQPSPLLSSSYTLPATIDMIFNLLDMRGGAPMSVAHLMTLLPPGRLQKVLGEVQSSSRFSCYFLPSKLLSAQGHLFISLKREESSHIQQPFSLSESVSATDNINESMIRLQTIERLLLSPGGELPAIEILLSFDIIPSDGAILRMLDLCPELDSQLSNDVIVFKLRGGLLQCSQRG